jgi:hypothetical protein
VLESLSVATLRIAYEAVKTQRTYADLNNLWDEGLLHRDEFVLAEENLAESLRTAKLLREEDLRGGPKNRDNR